MSLTTLILTQAVILLAIAALFSPKKWMSNEVTIKNTTVVKQVYKIRGTGQDNSNMLKQQLQV